MTPEYHQTEDNVAHRIAWEMTRRGWSQDRMAKEVTDAGCPIHQSAISKILKPRPSYNGRERRAISVDEAIAFAAVFGVPVEELTYPLAVARNETGRRLTLHLEDLYRQLAGLERQREDLEQQIAAVTEEISQLAQEER